MSLLRKAFELFIFSSFFIAVCAVLMVYQTALLFELDLSPLFYGFVCCGSICSYNFHWYLTPPGTAASSKKLSWNLSNKNLHFWLFLLGLIGAGIFALGLAEHWFWLGITAFLTFLYSAPMIPHPLFSFLKKVAIGKTIFLAFAWMHVTTLMPMVMQSPTLNNAATWFAVNRFFFIYAICILFDYRDVDEDRKAGIRSMITRLSEKGVDRIFWGAMAAFATSLLLLSFHLPPAPVIALLVPALILSLLYYPSKRNFSDYLYYFILDGLMMLSAPLLLLSKFAR